MLFRSPKNPSSLNSLYRQLRHLPKIPAISPENRNHRWVHNDQANARELLFFAKNSNLSLGQICLPPSFVPARKSKAQVIGRWTLSENKFPSSRELTQKSEQKNDGVPIAW